MEVDRSSFVCDDDWGEEDFFSDESSFYGDDDEKALYEARAASYDPTRYWQTRHRNLQCIAAERRRQSGESVAAEQHDAKISLKFEESPAGKPDHRTERTIGDVGLGPRDVDSKPEVSTLAPLPQLLFNPYEGDNMAKQMKESLFDFLSRLKPSTTTLHAGPWIWIANPHSKHRLTTPDISSLKASGEALLAEYLSRKRHLEESNPTKAAGSITRMLRPDRTWLEESLVTLARKLQVTCGKWMLFPYPNQVDEVWTKVCRATLDNKLGCAAKVATLDPNNGKPERLVCIYTEDFSDKDDVNRVLREMERLGLVGKGEEDGMKCIYYKCDAYTYLDIVSGNDYKLKASMYNSRDIFKEMAEQTRRKM